MGHLMTRRVRHKAATSSVRYQVRDGAIFRQYLCGRWVRAWRTKIFETRDLADVTCKRCRACQRRRK